MKKRKKLSLREFLCEDKEDEKTGAMKQMPGRKMANIKPRAEVPVDVTDPQQTVQRKNFMGNQQQDEIDRKDNMNVDPPQYQAVRDNLKKYEVKPNSYQVPENIADQLIKQFGTLEDARIEIFGNEGNDELTVQRAPTNTQQVNADAQKVKAQRPMPQQEPDLSDEEEAEVSQNGTSPKQPRGLPQNIEQMKQRYQQAMASGKPIEVWDPQTNQYKAVDPKAQTQQSTLPAVKPAFGMMRR